MQRLWVVVSIFALIEVVMPARAGSITNYSHYLVSGESVATLYQSMIKRGPHVGKGKAFASARMEPKVSATTAASRNSCRINRFELHMNFTIFLPRLDRFARISENVRRSFNRFYQFAKKHEETHRAIWLKCAAETEAVVRNVKAASCLEAEAEALKLVEKMASQCDVQHATFDISERARLANHPFMQAVRLTTKNAMIVQ
jgi:predicted secreted Zn-dependent protease